MTVSWTGVILSHQGLWFVAGFGAAFVATLAFILRRPAR